jgi:hypothetical protein
MLSLLILARETEAYSVHANKLRTITCYNNITQQIVVKSGGNVFSALARPLFSDCFSR